MKCVHCTSEDTEKTSKKLIWFCNCCGKEFIGDKRIC